jgi:hypothetical protein
MRRITQITLVLAFFVLALFAAPVAQAITLSFDDLPTTQNQGGQRWDDVPASYGGLNWAGWEVANGADYKSVYGSSYTSSPGNFAYNADGVLGVAIAGNLFNFLGADFSTWAQNDAFQSFSSKTVTVEGYRDATLVNSDSWNLVSNAFVLHSFTGFDNIDTLVIKSDGSGRWFAMDNFEYTSAAVPEPATILLLGLGLFGLLGLRRRFKK